MKEHVQDVNWLWIDTCFVTSSGLLDLGLGLAGYRQASLVFADQDRN